MRYHFFICPPIDNFWQQNSWPVVVYLRLTVEMYMQQLSLALKLKNQHITGKNQHYRTVMLSQLFMSFITKVPTL